MLSLLSLAIICFGVGYAVGRERLRDPDHLHALYQQTNKEFFGGQLRDVEVKSHDLSDYEAEGITYQETEDRFVIVLDPKWNTSEDEALRTMRHEACHVATWDVMDPNGRCARPAVSRMHETIHRKRIASMQERTNSELDVATMVMLLDYGMSLKDIAECFKLEAKTVERLIVEHQRSRASKERT